MGNLLRLTEFWNWLPAFRAVAESGHLPTASETLGVGRSSLSRSIAMLERRVGRRLFDRVGRGLRLNEDGERFLASVRTAMRHVDDGLDELVSPDRVPPLRVTTVGVLTYLAIPVLQGLRREEPTLVAHLQRERPEFVGRAILRGDLDIAMIPDPPVTTGIEIDELGTGSNGIYCGREHPLYANSEVSLDEVVEQDFAAPVPRDVGPRADGWPPSLERRVAMFVNDVRVAVDACVAGRVLAVLPDFVAASLPEGALRRLPHDIVPATTYYALRLPRIRARDVRHRFLDRMRDRLAASARG